MVFLDLNLNNDPYRSNKFDNSTNFGFGVELELVFPFYNNKWAAFIEPSYNSYSSSAHLKSREFFGTFHEQDVSAKINYIQTPIGGRHYMYLNDNFKSLKNSDLIVIEEELYKSKNPIEIVTKINTISFS